MQFLLHTLPILIILLFHGIPLSVQDIKEQKFSVWLLVTAIVFAAVSQFIVQGRDFYLYVISTIDLFVMYLIIRLVSKKRLGLGDVFLGILQGLAIRPSYIWICVYVEIAAAFIFWLINRKKRFFFVPFMIFSTIVTVLIENCIIYLMH